MYYQFQTLECVRGVFTLSEMARESLQTKGYNIIFCAYWGWSFDPRHAKIWNVTDFNNTSLQIRRGCEVELVNLICGPVVLVESVCFITSCLLLAVFLGFRLWRHIFFSLSGKTFMQLQHLAANRQCANSVMVDCYDV